MPTATEGDEARAGIIADQRSRSRSRSTARAEDTVAAKADRDGDGIAAGDEAHTPELQSKSCGKEAVFLCVLLGGPGSGKSLLCEGLQRHFPGLCIASGGNIARLSTTGKARESPLLNSISGQLDDRRRRRVGGRRLASVVNEVLADTLRSHEDLRGLVYDGARAMDLDGLTAALGCRVTCVLHLSCPRDILLERLRLRGSRDGDDRLGLSDTTDSIGRVEAYLQREKEEEQAMRDFLGDEAYRSVSRVLDGAQAPEEVLRSAVEAMHSVAHNAGVAAAGALLASAKVEGATQVDWSAQVLATAHRLYKVLHPDGRPRTVGA